MAKEQLTPKRITTTDTVISSDLETAIATVGGSMSAPIVELDQEVTTISYVSPDEIAMEVGQWVQSQFTSGRDRTALGAFEKVMRWRGHSAATDVQFEVFYNEFMSES